MKFLSVCSGIEAASVAWNPLGWEAAAFAEIEPFPCSVLAHHYPAVPNWGDMTKYQEWPDVPALDVLCGGTPCQSFSVAGLRAGLADPRGNLMLTFGAIAAKYRPRWLVWENVPGVLSSNGGRDFGSFLGLLGQLGYGFAYRVLDAQYFGVPQRRRRVFVVGCLGDWRSAAAVLFERHSLSGHPAPSRKAGQGATPILEPGARTGVSTTDPRAGIGIGESGDPMFTLQAGKQHGVVAPTLTATYGAQCGQDYMNGPMIAHSLRAEGFDASEDGTGRGTSPTLAANQTPAIAFQERGREDGRSLEVGGEVAYALTAPKDGGRAQERNVLTPTMQVRRLTPEECEALQGFPRSYTAVPHRGKPAADGPRYKALGNSWAVPCAAWIGRRIQAVEPVGPHPDRSLQLTEGSAAAPAGQPVAIPADSNISEERRKARQRGFIEGMSAATHRDLVSLLRRGLSQLDAWQRAYGEHQPAWLPPAGDVRWAEDVNAALKGEGLTAAPQPPQAQAAAPADEPETMSPAELARRVARGEKWKVATAPAQEAAQPASVDTQWVDAALELADEYAQAVCFIPSLSDAEIDATREALRAHLSTAPKELK
jgi:DNA (cytosine-5)-methyltransferase 1